MRKIKTNVSKMFLKSILVLPLHEKIKMHGQFWVYRIASDLLWFLVIILYLCVNHTTNELRFNLIFEYKFGLFMFIMCYLSCLMLPIIYILMALFLNISFKYVPQLINEERKIGVLFAHQMYHDIREWIFSVSFFRFFLWCFVVFCCVKILILLNKFCKKKKIKR